MVQDVQKRLEEEKFSFTQATAETKVAAAPAPAPPTFQEDLAATVSVGPDGKVECMLCRTFLDAVDHTTLHMVTHGIGTVICRCRACGQQGELAQFLRAGSVWCSGCHGKHVCEVCSKAFRSRGHLARHRLVHSGAKPFLCEVCGTGFSQRSSLKLHVLSHAGVNPHKCAHCGQTFRFRVSLRSHILNLHGTSPTSKSVDYGCDRCGKRFATVYKLHRHYRSHTGERPYECLRCGKVFSQTGNLNLHRKKHAEEDAATGAGFAPLDSAPAPGQYMPETGEVLPHDSKFLETILQHPDLSSIDTVLLNPPDKVPTFVPEFGAAPSDFKHKELFYPEGLLFDQQEAASSTALPTFSSLQSHSCE
ncbi:zinc finger protein 100-like isoform X2 [Periplaneta americana]